MFSTEELTLAAMRKGRDGQPHFYFPRGLGVLIGVFLNRHDDVPERCSGNHVLRVLLDALRRHFQRLAQGSKIARLIRPSLSLFFNNPGHIGVYSLSFPVLSHYSNFYSPLALTAF